MERGITGEHWPEEDHECHKPEVVEVQFIVTITKDSTYDHLKCHPGGREAPKLSLPNTSAPFLPTSALFPLLCEATGLSMHQEEKNPTKKLQEKEYYLRSSKFNPASSHLVRMVTSDTTGAPVNTLCRVSKVTSTRAGLEFSMTTFTQQKTQIL